METRKWIHKVELLVLAIFCSVSASSGQADLPKSSHYILQMLTDGVYVAIHNNDGGFAICNAGIIDLGDKTIVLDPFMSPAAARDLKQHAAFLTGRPASLVLNLDPHSDHTSGNQVFVPGADIISTPNARRYIQDHFDEEFANNKKTAAQELAQIQQQLQQASGNQKTELTLWECEYKAIIASLPELKMTLPNITISDTMFIHGSKRRLILIATGTGHTNGDMVAYLPEDKIFFLSDQLFVNCHPYLGDGDPESLKNNLKQIAKANPAMVVPGHGPVGDLHSLYMMIDYIETLTGLVNQEIQNGTNENQILAVPMPEKFCDYLIGSLYKINLKFLHRQALGKQK